MCAHMMWGQTYSAFPGMPMMLLGILLSAVLLAGVIWTMARWLPGKATPVALQEPQPRDEPYTSFEFSGSTFETSQEGHAELAPGNSVHDDELQIMYRPVNNHGATRSGESRHV